MILIKCNQFENSLEESSLNYVPKFLTVYFDLISQSPIKI